MLTQRFIWVNKGVKLWSINGSDLLGWSSFTHLLASSLSMLAQVIAMFLILASFFFKACLNGEHCEVSKDLNVLPSNIEVF
ncbi:E3 ubiquitin-protein ligase makorin [Corchorus olitorius]|uniref:E3 ubiquitin-protein ligase makorin n=1 Tax=Corchorus olitorius TaxID=93759 RepID=A0A1R3IEY2_9ROSI|nr:E3 ubiquitin-protein ligase makorin [Corchorus olitorius]